MSKWYPCIYCTEDLHCTKYSDDDSESWCVLGPCTAETPSNADRIRAMTDEELAEKLCKMQRYGDCPDGADGAFCEKDDCQKCWLDWLKEEARE